MVMVNELSCRQGLMSADIKNELNEICRDLIDDAMLACLSKLSMNNILSMLKKDKKTQSHLAIFVMPTRPGELRFVKIPIDEELQRQISDSLKEVLNINTVAY